MRKSRFTESQILAVLKDGEAGVPVAPEAPVLAIQTGSAFYRAGDGATVLLSNLGDTGLSYSYCYDLEAFDGSSWAVSPESPRLCTANLAGLAPGQTRAEPIPLRGDLAAGLYRLVFPVYGQDNTWRSEGLRTSNPFKVS